VPRIGINRPLKSRFPCPAGFSGGEYSSGIGETSLGNPFDNAICLNANGKTDE
jgi:hypothetical protein